MSSVEQQYQGVLDQLVQAQHMLRQQISHQSQVVQSFEGQMKLEQDKMGAMVANEAHVTSQITLVTSRRDEHMEQLKSLGDQAEQQAADINDVIQGIQ